jgi:hypothetical protein
MTRTIVKFRKAFQGRVKNLDLSGVAADDEREA